MDFAQPVLVVVDLRTMTRIVEAMLLKCGFSVIEQVDDAATALQRIKDQPFLFVLSDRDMLDMTGIDLVVRAVRAYAKTAMFRSSTSASNEAKDAEEAIAAGANTFITKPFSQTTLRANAIANLMRPRV